MPGHGVEMSGESSRERPATGPIGKAERDAALACLAAYDGIVLAVSGGADSMALLHLVAAWVRDHAVSPALVSVVTVNHGLRPSAGDEAEMVCRAAHAHGFSHTTIPWPEGPSVKSNIQEAARAARYRLLATTASAGKPARPAVVTAHTEDDQAETLLMRLGRGSGLDGLAAMPSARPLEHAPGITLVRPLLGFSKARLVDTLNAAGIAWIEDPSNENPRFERARVRALQPALRDLGLVPGPLALSAQRLSRARRALDDYAERAFAATVGLNGGLFAFIDRRALGSEPEEVRLRVMTRVIGLFGGLAPPPRLSEVEALMARLERARTYGATLGGTMITAGTSAIRVMREWGRSPPEAMTLEAGETALWDGRFAVSFLGTGLGPETAIGSSFGRAVTVRALGHDARARLAALGTGRQKSKAAGPAPSAGQASKRGFGAPALSYATLPSFWSGDNLIAVPTLAEAESGLQGPVIAGHAVCTARFLGCEARLAPLRND